MSEYSGRNCFSWVGGKDICVVNSTFNHAARASIKTKPGYGMDIEPEINGNGLGICMNGYFLNSSFKNNNGLGFTTGYSFDSPIEGLRSSGYTYNHYFKNCTIIGAYNAAIHNFIDRTTFDNCKFYGGVLEKGSVIDAQHKPTKYINSLFSDCYNGALMHFIGYNMGMEYAYKAIIDGCTFKKYRPLFPNLYAGQPILSRVDETLYSCSNSTYNPIIKNTLFSYFPQPLVNQNVLSLNTRNVTFLNNQFFKDPSPAILLPFVLGCSQNQGNVDLGNGLQEFSLTGGINDCSTLLICQDNLFISEDETVTQDHQTSNYIISDAKLIINNQNSSYKAANYVQLNAGFEATVSGTAQLEMTISDCTLPPAVSFMLQQRNDVSDKEIYQNLNKDVNIFPNPFNDVLKVQIEKACKNLRYYEIINLSGQVIYRQVLNLNAMSKFNVAPNILPGSYFIKLYFKDEIISRKILKL